MNKVMSSYVYEADNIGQTFLEYLRLKYGNNKIIIAVPADEEALKTLKTPERTRLENGSEKECYILKSPHGNYAITGAIEVITDKLPDKGKPGGPSGLTDPGRAA